MKNQYDNEELLTGGIVSNVYRLGDTVHRVVKSDNINIQKLLKHLEKRIFTYALRYLGTDEQGREVLTFIDGVAGHDPLMDVKLLTFK